NGSVAYKLELTPYSHIHPVFHVSCLKKVIVQKFESQIELPELDEEGRIILEPEKILQTRIKRLKTKDIKEYLIKWKNLSIEDVTWEDE
ncbi:hypothetical protein KI387_025212, partial [Taxus chinensis]